MHLIESGWSLSFSYHGFTMCTLHGINMMLFLFASPISSLPGFSKHLPESLNCMKTCLFIQ